MSAASDAQAATLFAALRKANAEVDAADAAYLVAEQAAANAKKARSAALDRYDTAITAVHNAACARDDA